ncbi:hypothetical protein ACRYCC_26175 [Actinomadura scrupuli]|uniref:hypothetical protein n=1 Tax=Actinomadura scrupuli TaxID=559629 RepID=UPI003D986380
MTKGMFVRHATQEPHPDAPKDRSNLLIWVALGAAAICASVLVFIAVTSGGGSGSSPDAAGATSAGPSSTTVLDSHAKIACQKLARAEQRRKGGDPFAKTQAGVDEFSAQTEAAGSTITALAEIAKREDGSPEVIAELRMWCAANGG